ncbi:hypothetical protein [Lewinella sp. IMCC34183]|uniref:hypothetical protein n=1 Tax=Lewinella sp. IMCC34183 TaxID=2248762 RepID=UPI000E287E4C|nr:hypothetical protein [Lewinella sp. IMCC34183]
MDRFYPPIAVICLYLPLLLFGCVGHKKYTRILEEEVAALSVPVGRAEGSWLSLSLPDSLSSELDVKVIHARFIPAVLYWGWNATLDCTLPAPLLADWFAEGATAAADSLGIRDRPDGGVTVRFEQLPARFVFTDRGAVLVLLVAYTTSEVEGIIPGEAPLEFSYTMADSHGAGRALFATGLDPVLNPGLSTRRFTRGYLVDLRRAVRQAGAEWVSDRYGAE